MITDYSAVEIGRMRDELERWRARAVLMTERLGAAEQRLADCQEQLDRLRQRVRDMARQTEDDGK